MQRFTREQEAILRQPVPPDLVEIRWDGTVYMPGAWYRKVLNDAFGPGGWALVETGPAIGSGGYYYLPCVLVCEGRPIATAIGEYVAGGNNPKAQPGMIKESCRTDAISKACKTLGVAEELWFPSYCRKWQAQYTIEVLDQRSGKRTWKRKDELSGTDSIKAGYSYGSEYEQQEDYDDQATSHIAAIQEEEGA